MNHSIQRLFTRMAFAAVVVLTGLMVFACAGSQKASSPVPAITAPAQAQEELWVVARSEKPPATGNTTGLGELRAKADSNAPEAPMPLVHTDVRAAVTGYVATVDLTQQFKNTRSQTTEAVYVFSLPPNAAVSDFLMTIGARRIRGVVRDRGEAEDIYRQAKSQGHIASLLTAESSGAFRQSIASIAAGQQIDITLTYHQVLPYASGWYEFGFPLKTAPSGGGSALRVDLDAGVPIEEATSPSHRITRTKTASGRLAVSLDAAERMSNANFILRYRVAGGRITTLPLAAQKLVQTNGLSTQTAFLSVDTKGAAPENRTENRTDSRTSTPIREGR